MNAINKCLVGLLAGFLGIYPVFSQQQFQGLCARVKIEILQELAIERIGFEATLEVTNNDGEDPITDFSAYLTFERPASGNMPALNDASSLFFVRTPELSNVSDVNGRGVIGPTKKAVVKWFIIPKVAAGGTNANGIVYRVGCNLAGNMRGVPIPFDVLFAIPDTITVKPDPQLDITYFQPRDVQGDDPFTPQVESPIPFTLGVLVKNVGYGLARKVRINSQQPKIVENKQHLLLIAQLLGTRVNDSTLSVANLLVNLGDIPPGAARKGAWDMITSLSGEFVEFKASYTHASELGGEETSVIKSLQAHFIAHEVLVDLPGRDKIKDFLADTDRDSDMYPDSIYESDGNILPVNVLTNAQITGVALPGSSITVNLLSEVTGWGYVRLNDPAQGKLKIASVVRGDGKVLNPNNYWLNTRYTRSGNIRMDFLNLLDNVNLGTCVYTITYSAGTLDITPPQTTIHFVGSVIQSGDNYYITPETQMYFISEDENPVCIYYSITNSPFKPALPFKIKEPGEYLITYYAIDSSDNRETNKTAMLIVSGASTLSFENFELTGPSLIISGDAVSVRPSRTSVRFRSSLNPAQVNAAVEIFDGVIGFVTVSNVPSSPTTQNWASLVIGGENVDYYRYKYNESQWSSERPVNERINLTNLNNGVHKIELLGRSSHGSYLSDSSAVIVSWVVDNNAWQTTVTRTPATPARNDSASLTVSGAEIESYRWTINSGYYRPESPVSSQIILTNLSYGTNTVAVIAKIGNNWQETNSPTTVSWMVDPLYGFEHTTLKKVRTVIFTNIGVDLQTFTWDGKNDAGLSLPPGWYTVRVTLYDTLNRTNFSKCLVHIDEVASEFKEIATVERNPKNPYARQNWIVWQDQNDGSWQIYARNINDPSQTIIKISTEPLSQESPRTDGRYAVWQGRQPNGTWDIYIKDLTSSSSPQRVTNTPELDEINPAVDYPWVVYQRKNVLNPSEPWQLIAINLANAETFVVSQSTQDELDPDVHAGQVVWQDFRDPGYGEIYYKSLETGLLLRITDNIYGQYKPSIFNNWIVWQDNRNGQVDVYGYNLLRKAKVRITATPENESRPRISGSWVICEEDSFGVDVTNLRLINLSTLCMVPVTRSLTQKSHPSLANERAVWLDTENNQSRVITAKIPALQPVFENRNAVVITETVGRNLTNAFNLLRLWNEQAGVREIVIYDSLIPQVTSKTASWINNAPAGDNFTLTSGMWVWIKFDRRAVLDLGVNPSGPINLAEGVNALSYTEFPDQFSAYKLLRQLGPENIRAVRMLNSESGNWHMAQFLNNAPAGDDFKIPPVAGLLIDMINAVNNYQPQ